MHWIWIYTYISHKEAKSVPAGSCNTGNALTGRPTATHRKKSWTHPADEGDLQPCSTPPPKQPSPKGCSAAMVGLYMSSERAAQVEALSLSSLGCLSPGAQSPPQPPPSSFSTPVSSALSYQDDFVFFPFELHIYCCLWQKCKGNVLNSRLHL